MKPFIFPVLLAFSLQVAAQQLEINGVYQSENLYIMNPFAATGVGFCITQILVNGEITTDEINSSSFEVDFAPYQFKQGQKVDVFIKHKDGCVPKVLNPEVLKPKSSFKINSISMDKTGILTWVTIEENGILPYVVQQYRWNKWITIGKVQGVGTPQENTYSFNAFKPVMKPHSGVNRYRVKQVDFRKRPRYSPESNYRPLQVKPVSILSKKISSELLFSSETSFEIFDEYGKRVLRGFGSKVNTTKLDKGKYYINFDSKVDEFSRK